MYNYYTAPNKWQYLQQQRTKQERESRLQSAVREIEDKRKSPDNRTYVEDKND